MAAPLLAAGNLVTRLPAKWRALLLVLRLHQRVFYALEVGF